ncbi:MAG: Arc family DNA-binding protein [Alphaproteobacteria bacterium]|nr:Arc family DNA-binding protein [Alphaproteobacteria bacterium]
MPVLTIRNLPVETHAKLRVRAAENGRSVEAEVRAILEDAVNGRRAQGGGVRDMAHQGFDHDQIGAKDGLPPWVGALKGKISFAGTQEDWKALDQEIEHMFEDAIDAPSPKD